MQTVLQNPNLSLTQFYQFVAQFTIEQQLAIAEHIKKQALSAKWNAYIKTMPTNEPDITEEEMMQEIKSVRQQRHAN
jgi:hypothetical protein